MCVCVFFQTSGDDNIVLSDVVPGSHVNSTHPITTTSSPKTPTPGTVRSGVSSSSLPISVPPAEKHSNLPPSTPNTLTPRAARSGVSSSGPPISGPPAEKHSNPPPSTPNTLTPRAARSGVSSSGQPISVPPAEKHSNPSPSTPNAQTPLVVTSGISSGLPISGPAEKPSGPPSTSITKSPPKRKTDAARRVKSGATPSASLVSKPPLSSSNISSAAIAHSPWLQNKSCFDSSNGDDNDDSDDDDRNDDDDRDNDSDGDSSNEDSDNSDDVEYDNDDSNDSSKGKGSKKRLRSQKLGDKQLSKKAKGNKQDDSIVHPSESAQKPKTKSDPSKNCKQQASALKSSSSVPTRSVSKLMNTTSQAPASARTTRTTSKRIDQQHEKPKTLPSAEESLLSTDFLIQGTTNDKMRVELGVNAALTCTLYEDEKYYSLPFFTIVRLEFFYCWLFLSHCLSYTNCFRLIIYPCLGIE